MKNLIKKAIAGAIAFAAIMPAVAQTNAATQLPYINNYDAGLFSSHELNGTARFMGVGGAMGALGGDASSLFYNPAGIGVYRSSEITVSVNGSWNNATANSVRVTEGDFNLQNVAYVGTWNFDRKKGLLNFNIGVGFNRMKNFNRTATYSTSGNNYSVSQLIAGMASGQNPDDLNVQNLDNPNVGWLPILGYSSGAIWSVGDADGNPTSDYVSYFDYAGEQSGSALTMNNDVLFRERGYLNEFTLSLGGNVSNIFYFGMSFICNVLDYSIYQQYDETLSDRSTIDLNSSFYASGTGFTYKVGFIVKPINWLRIGGAFHTPSWYAINTNSGGAIHTYTSLDDTYASENANTYTFRSYFSDPLEALGSLGFVIGKYCFIGIDYQYEYYKGMKIKNETHVQNQLMDALITNNSLDKHTVRLGVEFKPIDALALRLGGGYSTAVSRDGSQRIYYDNDMRTDLGYYNFRSSYNVSAGIGYYVGRNAFDLAYVWQVNHADYYPFSNSVQDHSISGLEVQPVGVRNVRNQIVFTYSIRF